MSNHLGFWAARDNASGAGDNWTSKMWELQSNQQNQLLSWIQTSVFVGLQKSP